ncbi:pyruvate dehydrogenase complex E1 component subunit beta, partial [candidate division KSB1 bacterium]
DAVKRAIDTIKTEKGPVLLECITYRYMGHSLSDRRTTYRSAKEEEVWNSLDCIAKFKQDIQQNSLLTADEIEEWHQKMKKRIYTATEKAVQGKNPLPLQIYDGIFTDTVETNVPKRFQSVSVLKQPRRFPRDSEGKIMYRHAVQEALAEEMLRDNRVVLYGEDVADYGGAFQATLGLFGAFGRERVFNAPISEAAIVGTGCGAAMAGLRPVVEIMYIDFMPLALDQLGNQVAKTRYMFGGKAEIPLVVRTTIGGGKGYAGQHSQSLEAICTHFPGLKVVAPSTAYDVKGLLKTSIRDNNPVVVIEHQMLYTEKDIVPEEEYLIPLGKANVRREGNDLTIISYLNSINASLSAAEVLSRKNGISVEVVDPRTLIPLDIETLVRSSQKTGRVMVVLQAPEIGCFGEHILYEIQQRAFKYLKVPPKIVGARNVPPPMAQTLENDNIPCVERIVSEARKLLS